MKKFMILFVIGKDRPGIVDQVSTFLFERGANIEDSRMAVLGGCFSIMTLFSCTPEESGTIKRDLGEIAKLDLETSLHDAEDPTTSPKVAALPLNLEIRAMDHPGIVQKITRILHEHNVNIESLNTQVTRAPLSGANLFNLSLEAQVPPDESISEVKEGLLDLAAEVNLDLSFTK